MNRLSSAYSTAQRWSWPVHPGQIELEGRTRLICKAAFLPPSCPPALVLALYSRRPLLSFIYIGSYVLAKLCLGSSCSSGSLMLALLRVPCEALVAANERTGQLAHPPLALRL